MVWQTLMDGTRPPIHPSERRVFAVLRWTFGKQTVALLPTLLILAVSKVLLPAKGRNAVTMTRISDTKEFVTRMDVTSILIEWVTKASLAGIMTSLSTPRKILPLSRSLSQMTAPILGTLWTSSGFTCR